MRCECLDNRASEILRCVVDFYLETGEPIGSQSISERYGVSFSPATIRNVMADLEAAGFLFSTHTSSGRAPTSLGINIFINELKDNESSFSFDESKYKGVEKVKAESAIEALSEATNSLSVLLVDDQEVYIDYIEIRKISASRYIFVMVLSDGTVKSSLFNTEYNISEDDIELANSVLNKMFVQKQSTNLDKNALDKIINLEGLNEEVCYILEKVFSQNFAVDNKDSFLIKGQNNLFNDVKNIEQFNVVKRIIDIVQNRESFSPILENVKKTEMSQVINCKDVGVADSCGCSIAVSPCFGNGKVTGVVGIVGHMKMNYKKIVPAVEFTARIISGII